jgi:hypothetical protein
VSGYEFKRHSLDSLRPLSMNRQLLGIARAARDRKDGANPVLKVVLIYQNFVVGVRCQARQDRIFRCAQACLFFDGCSAN